MATFALFFELQNFHLLFLIFVKSKCAIILTVFSEACAVLLLIFTFAAIAAHFNNLIILI